MIRKQVDFEVIVMPLPAGGGPLLESRVKVLLDLDAGWEVIHSHCFGLDNGGGNSGTGQVFTYTIMGKFEYS